MNLHGNPVARFLFQRLVAPNPRVRRILVRLWTTNRDEWAMIAGVRLWINSRLESGYLNAAQHTGESIVLRDEITSLLNLALLMSPGDTFVDVGANVGLYSVALSRLKRLYPGIRFYAFEPNPNTCKRLKRSVEACGVIVYDEAASDHIGKLHFEESGTSGGFHISANAGGIAVDALPLDAKNIEGASIVLKIDVEGHEMEVLRGAAGLFAHARVKAVFLDGYVDKEIPQWLAERGFELFDGRTLQPLEGPKYSLLAVNRNALPRQREGNSPQS